MIQSLPRVQLRVALAPLGLSHTRVGLQSLLSVFSRGRVGTFGRLILLWTSHQSLN